MPLISAILVNFSMLFKKARIRYYNDLIVRNPVLGKYRNGWLNRVNDIQYKP